VILARPFRAVAVLVAALLVFAPSAAHAAPGDVTAATLQWGFKASFRNYIAGPIAHGSWSLDGVTDATPFTWSDGTGSATSVGYPGSIHFQGHEGMGVPAGSYALDLTISNVRVVKASDVAASVVANIRSNSLSDPATFVTSTDVNFAAVDLAGGANASTPSVIAFTGAPASLTAEGADAFSGFYEEGAELDPVSFSWPVEGVTVPPAPTPTALAVTASPSAPVEGQEVKLSATVTPATAGELTVRSGAGLLGSATVGPDGRASLRLSRLKAGDKKFELTFVSADPLFSGSTASKSITVSPRKIGAGSLAWGVKQSFREYVTGPIAKGSISTSGAGASGGVFTFGQATGGTFDADSGTGTSRYSGSVRFQGHGGILDLTLASPVVRVESASRATLLVSISGGASVPFATLNLTAASRSTASGTVRYAGAPAALTSQGAAAFSYNGSSFYGVGTALDPVTFTIGSASSGGASTTVAAFVDTSNTPAATPPTTEGATASLAGGEVTIDAEGFEAGEEGILVVVYSDPVVLADDVTADASGAVSWTGRLPATLTGTHTLTLQGSVDRGAVIEIPDAVVTTAATNCPVDDATLTWGFKESFRSYISGSIAHGTWEVSEGATYEVPDFGFADGAGDYDAATSTGSLAFAGSIRFTGHDGVLDTTVTNPVVRFVDENTAIVVLDVTGVTQDGADIDAAGVEFVELDLTAATVANEGGAITIAGAPATLLPAGASAFGTYESGEGFDPVTLAFTTPECAAAPVASPVETPAASAGPDLSWLPWAIVGVLLAIIAALVVVVVRRRK
jgi:large repetitive protein